MAKPLSKKQVHPKIKSTLLQKMQKKCTTNWELTKKIHITPHTLSKTPLRLRWATRVLWFFFDGANVLSKLHVAKEVPGFWGFPGRFYGSHSHGDDISHRIHGTGIFSLNVLKELKGFYFGRWKWMDFFLAILLVTFLGWSKRDPFKGCWWPPTIGDQVGSRLESPGWWYIARFTRFELPKQLRGYTFK